MIEIVILYVLSKYDCTIYRLRKLIEDLFFAYLKTTCGTVTPALRRLEKLGCVEYVEKMSDGGMLSKIYSITLAGKKHLNTLLCTFEVKNPYHVLNDIKVVLGCSSVLSVNELIEFRNNLKNSLDLYKIKLQRGLEDEYKGLNDTQRKIVEITLNEVFELEKLL